MAYFALGETADAGSDYLRHYYAFTGPFAERIASGLLTSSRDLLVFLQEYEAAGCDEILLFPAISHAGQMDYLDDILWRL